MEDKTMPIQKELDQGEAFSKSIPRVVIYDEGLPPKPSLSAHKRVQMDKGKEKECASDSDIGKQHRKKSFSDALPSWLTKSPRGDNGSGLQHQKSISQWLQRLGLSKEQEEPVSPRRRRYTEHSSRPSREELRRKRPPSDPPMITTTKNPITQSKSGIFDRARAILVGHAEEAPPKPEEKQKTPPPSPRTTARRKKQQERIQLRQDLAMIAYRERLRKQYQPPPPPRGKQLSPRSRSRLKGRRESALQSMLIRVHGAPKRPHYEKKSSPLGLRGRSRPTVQDVMQMEEEDFNPLTSKRLAATATASVLSDHHTALVKEHKRRVEEQLSKLDAQRTVVGCRLLLHPPTEGRVEMVKSLYHRLQNHSSTKDVFANAVHDYHRFHQAATEIQRIVRGYLFRKNNQEVLAYLAIYPTFYFAAVTIQAVWRGKLARMELRRRQLLYYNAAARAIQKAWRARVWSSNAAVSSALWRRRTTEEDGLHSLYGEVASAAAAVGYQRTSGHEARDRTWDEQVAAALLLEDEEAREKAAIKIQAVWRGYRERQEEVLLLRVTRNAQSRVRLDKEKEWIARDLAELRMTQQRSTMNLYDVTRISSMGSLSNSSHRTQPNEKGLHVPVPTFVAGDEDEF